MPDQLPLAPLRRWALRHTLRWGHESNLGARRNAMVAATTLAQRRAELAEVEEYVASARTSRGAPDHERAARA